MKKEDCNTRNKGIALLGTSALLVVTRLEATNSFFVTTSKAPVTTSVALVTSSNKKNVHSLLVQGVHEVASVLPVELSRSPGPRVAQFGRTILIVCCT